MDRGKQENINDYYFGKIEQKFFHDKLKLGLIGAIGIMDWDNTENNYGLLMSPEVTLTPYESVEIALGGYIIDAQGDGFFTALQDLDLVYTKVKVNF